MQPSELFEQMLVELQAEMADLERRVFEALQKHPHGLTRQQLVALVYRQGRMAVTLNNDSHDRKVRKAIQSLREKGVPVFSSSGQAGYRLDASEAARVAMLADLCSRRDRLNELIVRVSRFRSVPDAVPSSPRQEQLF